MRKNHLYWAIGSWGYGFYCCSLWFTNKSDTHMHVNKTHTHGFFPDQVCSLTYVYSRCSTFNSLLLPCCSPHPMFKHVPNIRQHCLLWVTGGGCEQFSHPSSEIWDKWGFLGCRSSWSYSSWNRQQIKSPVCLCVGDSRGVFCLPDNHLTHWDSCGSWAFNLSPCPLSTCPFLFPPSTVKSSFKLLM